jgi:putative heme-binding domain-containing protein
VAVVALKLAGEKAIQRSQSGNRFQSPMNFIRILAAISLLPSHVHAGSWATSRVQGSPEPPHAFVSEPAFAGVALSNVTDMVPVPGLAQWLIAENGGKVWCVPDDPKTSKADVAIDMKALHSGSDHVYGMAFHPQFASNRQVFITYTNGDKKDDGSRLSRFRVAQEKPLIIDPKSEEILLTWRSGGHNGAAIAFGPDSMLYLSTGDSEVPNPPDPLSTGQDIGDLLSSILRVDVDHADSGKSYAVPPDNPFVKTPGARPEVWAYGLRNPWKMSFDRKTGNLWCGDVGWQEWENIFLIKRGGNYGWAATEGSNVLDMKRKGGPSPITPPVVTHSHAEAASITGGFVYHGTRMPELQGAYIYGDYETGKIWALWHDGTQVTRHEEIADTPFALVTFAQGEDGELYFVHYAGSSTVHRLVRNPEAGKPVSFPRKLSETGLFSDVAKQTPSPGVQAFGIRAPMWADGVKAQRFVGMVVGNGGIVTEVSTDKKTGRTRAKMTWPKNAVLAKTVRMEMTRGDATTAKNIETQMLHFDGEAWNAYSYRWNDAGTDAELVGAAGDERRLDLAGKDFPDGKHRYNYRFHSRAECLRCHNAWGDFALSFNPQQLAEPDKLIAAGCFDGKFMKGSNARLVNPNDDKASPESRARSWLHANCASCHREHGGGSVPLMVNAELGTDEIRAVDEKLTRGDFGISDARVIAPGLPGTSVLLHRIAKSGAGHMPMIGAREVDVAGLQLLATWVRGMAPGKPQPEDVTDARGGLNAALKLDRGEGDRAVALSAAKTSPNAHIRALFERYLPDSQRAETLGATATADKITKVYGDARRGAELFTPSGKGAACTACHFINGVGRDFGPDLSKVGARLNKDQIIESLLTPSKVIAQGFQAAVITLNDGSSQAGFIVKREGDILMLKIATGQTLPLKKSDVKGEQMLPASLMPEGLMQGFTAQEAADLVEHLSSLK